MEDVTAHGQHVSALQEGPYGRGELLHRYGRRRWHDRAASPARLRFLDDGTQAETFLEAGRQAERCLDDPVADDDHRIAYEGLHTEAAAVHVQFVLAGYPWTVHPHAAGGEEACQFLDLLDAASVALRIRLRPGLSCPSGHVLPRTLGEEAEGGGDSCGELGREGEVDDPAHNRLLEHTPVMGDVGDGHETGPLPWAGRDADDVPCSARRRQKSSRCLAA